MDENFDTKSNEPVENQLNDENINQAGTDDIKTDVNNYIMNDKGDIHTDGGDLHTGSGGALAQTVNSRTFLVLGWISAALTFLISPYFAMAGIVFGVLVNRQARGRGNALIITNVVLAVLNIVAIRLAMR